MSDTTDEPKGEAKPPPRSAVRVVRDGDVAVVRMEAGRANALDMTLLVALDMVFRELATSARAIVLTGQGSAFSAGLPLPDLINHDRLRMKGFIDNFTAVMERIRQSPLPVVAAVNGHAIAGGCVLALMCDVRIAAIGGARIGLNETQLGIGLPAIVTEPLRARLPPAAWMPVALEGRLFEPEVAIRLGLLDEVVPADELDARALARARELAAIPAAAFAQVKAALGPPLDPAAAAEQTQRWLRTWFDHEAQTRLRAAVDKLRK